jgi:hypothetical protein
VGDLYMSLIHTCELKGANPFDYLTELLRHAKELKAKPSEWMPWNYRATLGVPGSPPPGSMMFGCLAERIVGGHAIGHLKRVYTDFADSALRVVRPLSSMICGI